MADATPKTPEDFAALALVNAETMRKHTPKPAAVGDIWHRVEGAWIDGGSEMYEGVKLEWTRWRCVKTTPRGAWFSCMEWPHKRQRFALTSGAKALSRTQREALKRLVARKVRQLRILEGQKTEAEDTLEIARAALSAMEAAS